MVQVADVFDALVTVATKFSICEGRNVADVGVTETATAGVSEMIALDDLVVSATLVAVTVTVCGVVIVDGAK